MQFINLAHQELAFVYAVRFEVAHYRATRGYKRAFIYKVTR